MNRLVLSVSVIMFYALSVVAVADTQNRDFGLNDVDSLIMQNRSVIIENYNNQISNDNYLHSKSGLAPDLNFNGDGYYTNRVPINSDIQPTNAFLYHFKLSTEFDVYTGGMHTYAIRRMRNEKNISEHQLEAVQHEVQLKAYIILYDIYRNLKYKDFIESSILLRQKEYERIELLYENGAVLKSDLLRSKLYITDLQKDEVNIENSIAILSDQLCSLLGLDERFNVLPVISEGMQYQLMQSFDELCAYAHDHSPHLQVYYGRQESTELQFKEMRSDRIPHLKLYANYGVGSDYQIPDYNHNLGGEVGARLSFSISSFYKSNHNLKAQRNRINLERMVTENEEEKLRNTIFELYTRYNESLVNIDRAIEKIAMSEETTRILRNSYYNQQALLIDVLESETQSMEASFEWVEAVVDSQKYYWAIQQICGYL